MVTANKHRGDIVIEMDRKKYVLRYDWEAVGKLITDLGPDFDEKIAKATIQMDLSVIAETLVIGLQRHHPGKLTAKDIIGLSPPIVSTTDAVNKAISLAFYGTTEAPKVRNPMMEKILKLVRIFSKKPEQTRTATV